MGEGISLIEKGLVLMGTGMGIVGLFLGLMVIVMHISSFVLKNFETETVPEKSPRPKKPVPPQRPKDDLSEVAAAIAAVKAHMRIQGR